MWLISGAWQVHHVMHFLQMPCLLRTFLLRHAVAIPAAIVATVFLTSFVYSCYRYLVTPVLAEASTASAASAAATMHAPQQEQKIPVIIVQPGQQVKPGSSQHPAYGIFNGFCLIVSLFI